MQPINRFGWVLPRIENNLHSLSKVVKTSKNKGAKDLAPLYSDLASCCRFDQMD